VVKAVQVVEQIAAAERRRSGARVVGRRSVLDQKWSDRPSSREPRRRLNPRVAAWNKWSRIEALLRNRAFRDAYAAARAAYATGIRNIIFPAGTYCLRRFTRALCDTCPAPTSRRPLFSENLVPDHTSPRRGGGLSSRARTPERRRCRGLPWLLGSFHSPPSPLNRS